MSTILWLQAIRESWDFYLKSMNKKIAPDSMDNYLKQNLDLGMNLDEFAEAIFIAGFSAGEKYAKSFRIGSREFDVKLN
jgi:hypothetical protein